MSYLGNRLKLAVPVINQIHQGADSLRGIKVVRQCLHHAGFSFSQPKTASNQLNFPKRITFGKKAYCGTSDDSKNILFRKENTKQSETVKVNVLFGYM